MDNNVYLLTCTSSGAQALVDAADDAARLLALVQEGGGGLDLVVTTHQHWDHHRALARSCGDRRAARPGPPTPTPSPSPPDVRARAGRHGSTVGDVHAGGAPPARPHARARWRSPTETPTAAVHLFTGDCLFPGGVGNVKNEPERFASLLDRRAGRGCSTGYDDETWVYPGHGADTTLGAERPSLPLWRERGW